MNPNFYLNQQKQLAAQKWSRWFWQFWGIYSVFFVFAISLYFLLTLRQGIVILALCAFVIARLIISPLIYLVYKKERPYQKFKFVPIQSILFSKSTKRLNSFPSDHAVSFASITSVFFWYSPDLGYLMIFVTILNGLARIVLGYHYPWHVLAGWIIGILSALLAIHFMGPILFTSH